jgi:hypothetical protein
MRYEVDLRNARCSGAVSLIASLASPPADRVAFLANFEPPSPAARPFRFLRPGRPPAVGTQAFERAAAELSGALYALLEPGSPALLHAGVEGDVLGVGCSKGDGCTGRYQIAAEAGGGKDQHVSPTSERASDRRSEGGGGFDDDI